MENGSGIRADDRPRLRICVNLRAGDIIESCGRHGSRALADALEAGLRERGLPWRLERAHCLGYCHLGPTIKLLPNGSFVMGARAEDAPRILDRLAAGEFDRLAAEFPMPVQD